MKWIFGEIAVLSLALAGSAVAAVPATNADPAFVHKAASDCTDQILAAASGKPGEISLGSRPYPVKAKAGAKNSAAKPSARGLPYVEAEAVDNGVPGSAWKKCMGDAGAPL